MSDKKMHVEDAVDSKLAKTVVRILVWLAPFVVTGVSALIVWQLNEIRATQEKSANEFNAKQARQGEEIKAITSKVDVMNTKIDAGLIWRISEVERRLNQVEQAQKTQ